MHYSYESIVEHLQRNIHYSALAARQRFASHQRPSMGRAIIRAGLRFLKSLVFKRGYQAGWRGWAIAALGASVYIQRELLLAEWRESHDAEH